MKLSFSLVNLQIIIIMRVAFLVRKKNRWEYRGKFQSVEENRKMNEILDR